MQYRLDIYQRQPDMLMTRLAANCKARRLEKGYSRRHLAEVSGVPAPTLERFERTGKISLESFCRLVTEFDYYDEMEAILSKSKFTTSGELEAIQRNKDRRKGR